MDTTTGPTIIVEEPPKVEQDTQQEPTSPAPPPVTDPGPRPTDVFICCHSMDRIDWLTTTVSKWRTYDDAGQIELKIMLPMSMAKDVQIVSEKLGIRLEDEMIQLVSFDGTEFQRGRRIVAEHEAESDIYIVADDDCIPIGNSFIRMGLKTMADYPEFAILCPLPDNANINPWTPEPDEYVGVVNDTRVMEHVDVGGIRFCRKDVMGSDPTEWRRHTSELEGRYDRMHCIQIRERGARVGYIKAMRFHHLGEKEQIPQLPEPDRVIGYDEGPDGPDFDDESNDRGGEDE